MQQSVHQARLCSLPGCVAQLFMSPGFARSVLSLHPLIRMCTPARCSTRQRETRGRGKTAIAQGSTGQALHIHWWSACPFLPDGRLLPEDWLTQGAVAAEVVLCARNHVPAFQGRPSEGNNQRSPPIHPQTRQEKHRKRPNMPSTGFTLTVPANR